MKNNQGGFIYTIILIIVALILLKYFLNFDVIEFVKSPAFQKTWSVMWENVKSAWYALLSLAKR